MSQQLAALRQSEVRPNYCTWQLSALLRMLMGEEEMPSSGQVRRGKGVGCCPHTQCQGWERCSWGESGEKRHAKKGVPVSAGQSMRWKEGETCQPHPSLKFLTAALPAAVSFSFQQFMLPSSWGVHVPSWLLRAPDGIRPWGLLLSKD